MSSILEVQGSNLVWTPLYELKCHLALVLFAKCMCNVAHPWFVRLTQFLNVAENPHDFHPYQTCTSSDMCREMGTDEIFGNNHQPSSSPHSSTSSSTSSMPNISNRTTVSVARSFNHRLYPTHHIRRSHLLPRSVVVDLLNDVVYPTTLPSSTARVLWLDSWPLILALTGFNWVLYIVRFDLRLGRLSPCPDRFGRSLLGSVGPHLHSHLAKSGSTDWFWPSQPLFRSGSTDRFSLNQVSTSAVWVFTHIMKISKITI